jgi:Bacterial regulatory protein, Fis family
LPVSITQNATATVTLFIQFLIFVYLYYSSTDRPRFFRYMTWALGLMVVLKASYLSRQFFEASRAIGLLDAARGASTLFILTASMAYRWSHSQAAEILGIGRTTLWRKLKEYHIEVHFDS